VPVVGEVEEELEPERVASPAGQAIGALAEAMGRWAVACELPEEVLPIATGERSHLDGRVLHMVVREPLGDRKVRTRGADEASGRVRWDEQGCTFEEIVWVEVSGHVVWGDGPRPAAVPEELLLVIEPVPEQVRCGFQSGLVDDDGQFTIELDEAEPCELSYVSYGMGGGAWRASVHVDPMDPPGHVVLGTLELQEEESDPRSQLEQWEERMVMWRGEYDILGEQADPYLVALEEPGLSEEARELLDGWQKREAAAAAERREQARELEEMLRARDETRQEMVEAAKGRRDGP